MLEWPAKYPAEVLNYEFDWADALDGDTIDGSPTAVARGSNEIVIGQVSTVGTVTTIWVSGGKLGPGYVRLTASTSGGRTIVEDVRLNVLA